jgi:hypothetical protein
MTPQQSNQHPNQDNHPTSPWTEAYQAMSSQAAQPDAQPGTPERPYEDEAQAPTHDALSSIYNRGY